MNRRLIILSQANIETHSRMRSSMILKDSVFRKEQRTHTISPERPTFLSLPCNPPQNQHRRINCMKARARFLFPIPYLLLPQHHVLPFSFHILEYFSKHTKDRKAGPARRPCGLVAREKIFLTLRVSVFFHGKPCRRPPKNKLEEAQEIRMPTRVGHV